MKQRVRAAANGIFRILTVRRLALYSVAWLAFLVSAFVVVLPKSPLPHGLNGEVLFVDYAAHLIGGRTALDQQLPALYDLDRQMAVQDNLLGETPEVRRAVQKRIRPDRELDRYVGLYFFVSPPFMAYVYAPFAMLPYMAGATVWVVLSVVLLIVSLRLIWPLVPNLHHAGFIRVAVIACASESVHQLLILGQDAAITLLLLALGLRLLWVRRDALAGAVLGLGVFKPHFFLLIPVLFLLQRRWRALGAWVITATLLTCISVGLVGIEGAKAYVALLSSDLYRARVDIPDARSMISLIALVRSLGLASLVPSVAAGAVVLLAIGFGQVVARPVEACMLPVLYAVTILITVLVAPHALIYDGVVLFIPALILMNERPLSNAVRLPLVAIYLFVWLCGVHVGTFGLPPLTVIPVVVLIGVARQLLTANASAHSATILMQFTRLHRLKPRQAMLDFKIKP